jgi:alpha-tubulin suppressor-like RCC1 family protein
VILKFFIKCIFTIKSSDCYTLKIQVNKKWSLKMFLYPQIVFFFLLTCIACTGRFNLKKTPNKSVSTTTASSTTITNKDVFSNVTSLVSATSGNFNCIQQDGNLPISCWGDNSSSQLGQNSSTASASPLAVQIPAQISTSNSAFQIALGKNHACLSKKDGTIHCWGNNSYGKLGVASSSPSLAFTGAANQVRFSSTVSSTNCKTGKPLV